jgi:uncharacterized protein YprB with RNaseH-like and TPR domain
LPEPRIAFFDIETAPSLGYYFDRYKEGNIVATESPWFMLSFAWKWAGDKSVQCKALCDYPSYKKSRYDDQHLVRDLWKIFDEADILVGHNADRFDVRKTNSRFLCVGLPPPSPYKTIDTLKIARRTFKQDSNRLAALGQDLGLGGKLPTTGWDTWKGAIDGDPRAWSLMKRYNKRDVSLLEQVYLKLRPWHTGHPDLRTYTGLTGCPACQSKHVQCRGFNVAKTRKTQRMQCRDCGHWFAGRIIKDEIA